MVAARTASGRDLWLRDGRFVNPGEIIRQPDLGRTFRSLADGGPAAFYEGEFGEEYVGTARAYGGLLTLDDMACWSDRPTIGPITPVGDYFGHQMTADGALMIYGMHLAQACDLGRCDQAESVYRQIRVMEEVFHASRHYCADTYDQFVDRSYADERIEAVLSEPVRATTYEHFWPGTNTIVVRDLDENVAWMTHSINTPNAFGAGILVGGAYAVRAINEWHAREGDVLAPGLFTELALFRNGRPYAIAASPGHSCVHAPMAFLIGLVQRELKPLDAIKAPRFGLAVPLTNDRQPFESHYGRDVFAMLERHGIPYFECSPSPALGRVSAVVVNNEDVHALQDPRMEGTAATLAL
jgi:gamma-glutamyltranspeptidase/glutathione hydrolase